MNLTAFTFVLGVTLTGFTSVASTKWTNCPVSSEAEAIADVFRKLDTENGYGPTYNLPSGQILQNAGSVCSKSKIENLEQWTKELKTGLNPTKTVKNFELIRSTEQFRAFLNKIGTSIDDEQSLESSVSAFLDGKSSIIVGSSKSQAVIVLARRNGNGESALLLQLDK